MVDGLMHLRSGLPEKSSGITSSICLIVANKVQRSIYLSPWYILCNAASRQGPRMFFMIGHKNSLSGGPSYTMLFMPNKKHLYADLGIGQC